MKNAVLLMTIFVSMSVMAENIDLSKSSITWRGSKITGDFHTGPITIKNAKIKDGKGEIVVDMNSIDETTLNGEWKNKFLTHIKSEDFFDVKKYPTAQLKVEKIDNGYLYGKLTIKNKTHDVTVPFTKNGNTYSGELGFDRTKFDMIYGSSNFFKNLGDKIIADTVTLKFAIVVK